MKWWRRILLALAAGASLYACSYPEFEFVDDEGSGAAPATSTSTTGGGGGGGAGAASTSTGGGEPACNLLDPNDPTCEAGTKCGVVDVDAGTIGCVEAGTRPPWARCDADAECGAGLYCDPVTSVCRPYCQSANNCPSSNAKCVDARKAGGALIPGIKVCTAHCHPQSAVPCSDSAGPTTCFFNTQLVETDCGATKNFSFEAPCETVLDCRRGALCVADDGETRCREVCSSPGNQAECFLNELCFDTNPKLDYEETTYGICIAVF